MCKDLCAQTRVRVDESRATVFTEPMDRKFTQAAWLFTAYLVGVILFGAWVRITHSGAGCGAHWPLCDGEIIPSAPSTEKLIEYTHRLTSGLCGVFGLILTGWAWRRFGLRAKATIAAAVTLFFIIVEGAIGAGLVLAELVADDSSAARAIVISLHLTNTLMLTAASAATAYFGRSPDAPFRLTHERGLLLSMVAGFVVVSMTGAITALGDTLFPVKAAEHAGLWAQVSSELSATQHFLVRLRIVHPLLAVLIGLGMIYAFDRLRDGGAGRIAAAGLLTSVAQIGLGFLNIALAAPGWMQLLHLAMAQVLWVCLVLSAWRAQRPELAERSLRVEHDPIEAS